MDTLKIAQSLQTKYVSKKFDNDAIKSKNTYLSESIIPSATLVFSGYGATLQTSKGELIDLSSMTVNCILGQNDPWVNANLIAYLLSGRPSFLTTRLGSDFYYKVAKRIIKVTKMPNAVINHRQCNGTDVTELAVLAAYRHREKGQNKLVSFKNSYHGQGLTAYHMSGLQLQHKFLINDSPVVFLNEPTNTQNIDAVTKLSQHDLEILQNLEKISESVFAVIIEPIQVNNAVNTPSKTFLKELKTLCNKKKIALIFDEVQTGFGWLGTMTAAERFGVYPNLLALSKAVTAGNGPMAVLVSDKKYQDIPDGSGAKTNGADIRSLVASYAVMDRLMGISIKEIPAGISDSLAKELTKGLLSQFSLKNQLFQKHLEDLQNFSRGMVERINGDGLIRGLELVTKKGIHDSKLTAKLQHALLDNGVLVRHHGHTLIFKPPIVITEKELEKGFDKIKKVFKKYI